jgi:hypothetical protein
MANLLLFYVLHKDVAWKSVACFSNLY